MKDLSNDQKALLIREWLPLRLGHWTIQLVDRAIANGSWLMSHNGGI